MSLELLTLLETDDTCDICKRPDLKVVFVTDNIADTILICESCIREAAKLLNPEREKLIADVVKAVRKYDANPLEKFLPEVAVMTGRLADHEQAKERVA